MLSFLNRSKLIIVMFCFRPYLPISVSVFERFTTLCSSVFVVAVDKDYW